MAIIDERNIDVSSQSYQQATLDGNRPTEVLNAFCNHFEIWKQCNRDLYYKGSNFRAMMFEHLKNYARFHMGRLPSRADLSALKGTHSGPCIVVGSGPSLNDNIEHFHKWKGGIICSQSQAATLRYYDADPSHILVFDGKANYKHMSEVDAWDYEKSSLIMSPTCSPTFLQHWKGRIIFYRTWDPYIDWYNHVIRIAYAGIKGHHLPFACSLTAQIAIAHFLGYSPIYLFGADLGWREGGGRSRFDTMAYQNGAWVKKVYPEPNVGTFVRVGPYVTDSLTLFYRITTASLIWLDQPDVICCSDGLLNEFLPVDTGWSVIERQGAPAPQLLYKDKQKQREDLAPFLAANERFWVDSGTDKNGDPQYKLISCVDWKNQLPVILARMVEAGEDIDPVKEMEKARRYRAEAERRGYVTEHRYDGKPAASKNNGTLVDNGTMPEVVDK